VRWKPDDICLGLKKVDISGKCEVAAAAGKDLRLKKVIIPRNKLFSLPPPFS
jgi:hypothetical protein